MTIEELENFGRMYSRMLGQKVRCYELAAEIFEGDSEFLRQVQAQHRSLETMPPLDIAVIVLDSWGAVFPDDILAKANCVRTNFPPTITIN